MENPTGATGLTSFRPVGIGLESIESAAVRSLHDIFISIPVFMIKHPVRLERTRFSFRFQDREIQKTGC